MTHPIKILLIEKFPVVRAGLRKWLADAPDFLVVGEAATANEGLLQIKQNTPHMVLLDINAPDRNSCNSINALKAEDKNLLVLVIGNRREYFYAWDMMKKGADGYFSIHGHRNELIRIVRNIRCKKFHIEDTPQQILHERFTAREYEVFYSLCCGDKPSSTARKLALSLSTVRKYKKNIFAKIKVSNELQLIRYAAHHNILDAVPNE